MRRAHFLLCAAALLPVARAAYAQSPTVYSVELLGSQGVGVAWKDCSTVLTLNHLFDGQTKATVSAHGEEVSAHLVYQDPDADLAILRLERAVRCTAGAASGNDSGLGFGTLVTLEGDVPVRYESVGSATTPRRLACNLGAGTCPAVAPLDGPGSQDVMVWRIKYRPDHGESGAPILDDDGGILGLMMFALDGGAALAIDLRSVTFPGLLGTEPIRRFEHSNIPARAARAQMNRISHLPFQQLANQCKHLTQVKERLEYFDSAIGAEVADRLVAETSTTLNATTIRDALRKASPGGSGNCNPAYFPDGYDNARASLEAVLSALDLYRRLGALRAGMTALHGAVIAPLPGTQWEPVRGRQVSPLEATILASVDNNPTKTFAEVESQHPDAVTQLLATPLKETRVEVLRNVFRRLQLDKLTNSPGPGEFVDAFIAAVGPGSLGLAESTWEQVIGSRAMAISLMGALVRAEVLRAGPWLADAVGANRDRVLQREQALPLAEKPANTPGDLGLGPASERLQAEYARLPQAVADATTLEELVVGVCGDAAFTKDPARVLASVDSALQEARVFLREAGRAFECRITKGDALSVPCAAYRD